MRKNQTYFCALFETLLAHEYLKGFTSERLNISTAYYLRADYLSDCLCSIGHEKLSARHFQKEASPFDRFHRAHLIQQAVD